MSPSHDFPQRRFSPILVVFVFALLSLSLVGCGSREKSRRALEKTLQRSAVVFICVREDDHFVVQRILKAQPSWGSNIKVGEKLTGLHYEDDVPGVGVLVTREMTQWAINGRLAQGAIPFDRNGVLMLGNMTLEEVEVFLNSTRHEKGDSK